MKLALRIYYEDTDAGGVVYYANYLRFLERGRTEFIRALGVEQRRLLADSGLAFAVRSLAAEYLKPARLDDLVEVETRVEALGRAQVTFAQTLRRDAAVLLTARVRVACLDLARGKPAALPASLRTQLSEYL